MLIKSMILHLKKKNARNEGVWLIWCPLDIAGLKIMAGKWTMSGQYDHLSRQTFSWLVILTDHANELATYISSR